SGLLVRAQAGDSRSGRALPPRADQAALLAGGPPGARGSPTLGSRAALGDRGGPVAAPAAGRAREPQPTLLPDSEGLPDGGRGRGATGDHYLRRGARCMRSESAASSRPPIG